MIDPQARVHPDARLGSDVSIGPWTVVGPDVEIGSGTVVGAHCVLAGPTRIGNGNRIHSFCSIGDDPQDKKFVGGGESRLVIGDGNTIREYCSINRGTEQGGGVTGIGDGNWIMAYCHIAHDCQIGNGIVMANNATLAGHVEVGDFATLGGFTGVHQFCRLGEGCFTAISSVVVRDVLPFVTAAGNPARPRAINVVGLQRRGLADHEIVEIRRAYKAVYRDGLTLARAVAQLEQAGNSQPWVAKMHSFIIAAKRGISR